MDIDRSAYPLDVLTYVGKINAVGCGFQEYVRLHAVATTHAG